MFKNQPNQKLLYFDGFAGSGDIEVDGDLEENKSTIEGAAVFFLSENSEGSNE